MIITDSDFNNKVSGGQNPIIISFGAEWSGNAEKYYKAMGESVAAVKEIAFQDLKTNAINLKANAVVGIKVDIELNATNFVTVSITGTAVKVA